MYVIVFSIRRCNHICNKQIIKSYYDLLYKGIKKNVSHTSTLRIRILIAGAKDNTLIKCFYFYKIMSSKLIVYSNF